MLRGVDKPSHNSATNAITGSVDPHVLLLEPSTAPSSAITPRDDLHSSFLHGDSSNLGRHKAISQI